MLHERRDVRVDRRVQLPTIVNPKRRREIDVLISGSIANYPLQIAIECKNYAERIGVEKIDEFKGKLESVGIPPQHGVFVTVSGFTADAMDRASGVGIRTFVLTGLTPDRLATEIQQALQSIVYLLLEVVSVVITSDAPDDQADVMLLLKDEKGEPRGYVMDLIWAKWRDGHIPFVLGTHDIEIDLPSGWQWAVECHGFTGSGRATVRVLGLVISMAGPSERYILTDASTGSVERLKVRSSFDSGQRTFPITTVESEDDLTTILNKSAGLTVTVGRIPLPRIRYGPMYWPPSQRALEVAITRTHQLFRQGVQLSGISRALSFLEIEGSDLNAAFEPIIGNHPAITDPDWPGWW